jgi:hypothetical protein
MKTIKIKTKGKDQILNIPDKYKLSDDEVYLKKLEILWSYFLKINPGNFCLIVYTNSVRTL